MRLALSRPSRLPTGRKGSSTPLRTTMRSLSRRYVSSSLALLPSRSGEQLPRTAFVYGDVTSYVRLQPYKEKRLGVTDRFGVPRKVSDRRQN